MDEDYLDMARLSNYRDSKYFTSLEWLYQPVSDRVEEFRRVDDFEFDAREFIRDLDTTAVQESLSKLEKLIKDGPGGKKKLTLAETMELLKKGLKPYFYDAKICKLAELNIENEESASDIKWLHPKMAEKINERYAEITRLEVELHQYTMKVKNEIKELHERIQDIEDKGTDLII